MKIRYSLPFLIILIVTNAVTAFFLVQHHASNGYAEITFRNLSPNTIQSVWLEYLSLEQRAHDIKRGDQKSIRFYVDKRNVDHTCHIVVIFASGQGHACDVMINNGDNSTVYVYEDRIESDILKLPIK